MSCDNRALRLTPIIPHEPHELCWQTAVTILLRTAGKSLLLLIRRAISARLRNLPTSDVRFAAGDARTAVSASPIVTAGPGRRAAEGLILLFISTFAPVFVRFAR